MTVINMTASFLLIFFFLFLRTVTLQHISSSWSKPRDRPLMGLCAKCCQPGSATLSKDTAQCHTVSAHEWTEPHWRKERKKRTRECRVCRVILVRGDRSSREKVCHSSNRTDGDSMYDE